MARNHPKRQHYVPQFLLRAFVDSKSIHAFDKKSSRAFPTSVRSAACQSGFYDFHLKDTPYTLEYSLGDIESDAAPVISKIIAGQSLAKVDDEERAVLARFCSVQALRTPNTRELLSNAFRELHNLVSNSSADPTLVENLEVSDEDLRKQSITQLMRAPNLVPLYLDKPWGILKSEQPTLYTSDNPLSRYNSVDSGPYGNLGLSCKGIQLFLPLSPNLCLWIFCDSILDTPRIKDSIDQNQAIDLTSESVTFLNSLQVQNAERFVYSRSGDFKLAERMIDDHKPFGSGPRVTVG